MLMFKNLLSTVKNTLSKRLLNTKSLLFKSKMGVYSFFEDKWYSVIETVNKVVPVTKLTDRIDNHFPSFILFLIIILALLLLFLFTPSLAGQGPGGYDVELTVINKIGLPLRNAEVKITSFCELDNADSSFEQDGLTDEDGKITLQLCQSLATIKIEKTGYKRFLEEVDTTVTTLFKLSPVEIEAETITVFVKDEQSNLLSDALIEIVCDGNTTTLTGQPPTGFLVEPPTACSLLQIRASAQGYKEKTKTLANEERVIIELEKEVLEGKVIFETKTPTKEEGFVEIRITNSQYNSFTEITDGSGTKETTLEAGEYTYNAISQNGEVITGNFSIFTNSTERVNILFTDNIVESTKGIYVKIVDELDNGISNARVSMFKDGNSFALKNTDSRGETKPIKVNPDTLPNGTTFSAVITAPGYETKLTALNLVDVAGEPQKITIHQGGATIKVNHIDDIAGVVKNAFTTLNYNGSSEIFSSGTSDRNGEVLFQNLPAGEYTIHSVYTRTDSKGEATLTIAQDATKEVTLTLIIGTGAIKFGFLNQVGSKIDANYEFYEELDGMLQKTISGESTRKYYSTSKIKNRTKVKLTTTTPEYFPHETITYTVNRSTQSKDVFLRELNSLPNNENVQMFLVGVYETDPLTKSFKSASRITSGKPYYLYFDIILNNENADYLVGNFKIGDGAHLVEPISIENAYSIEGYTRVMTRNFDGFIIDATPTNLVDANAKQLNVTLANQQGKKSVPLFLEIKVDENAPGELNVPLYFEARHGDEQSLLYTTNIVVGESICLFEYDSDCPAFLLSHYLKWNDEEYVPLKDNHIILIGDNYTIKTTIKNLTDEDIGTAILKLEIPKEKMRYLTVGNDTNNILHTVNLFPFGTTLGNETQLNPIKKTSSGKINLSIEKNESGLNSLRDYELNEDQISVKIVDKEELAIEIIPNIIYQDAEYPFFIIKTKYKSQYRGVTALWYVEKNGARIGAGYEGQTDVNGIEIISFDATSFDDGDILTFVAEDTNGNLPARLDVEVGNPFPPALAIVADCLTADLSSPTTNSSGILAKKISNGGTAKIVLNSDCNIDRPAFIYTDLLLSEKNFTVPANGSKTITITGNPRDNIFGVYPVQVLSINGAGYSPIKHMDIIIESNTCFTLEDAILDFRQPSSIDTLVRNSCFAGRKDNFYPKANISTNNVSLQYNKPGVPEIYNFTAKTVGHAIESIGYGFVKSDVMYIRENQGHDSDPYDVPTSASEMKSTDAAQEMCEEMLYEGEYIQKPEPELVEVPGKTTVIYVPSNTVPTEGSTSTIIDTGEVRGEEKVKRISFQEPIESTIGTMINAVAEENGVLGGSGPTEEYAETCASPNNYLGCCTRASNCGPYHPPGGYTMEYSWDVLHDIYGTATPGAPRPPGWGGPGWEGILEGGSHNYYVLDIWLDKYARIDAASYLGEGLTYMNYFVKGDLDCSVWGCSSKTAYIKNQVDTGRYVEFFKEKTATWDADINIVPIEGRVYDVGAYSATPTPDWTNEEDETNGEPELHGMSLYTNVCVIPNGFVNPERAGGGVSHEWNILPASDPFVEYDPSGTIMYTVPETSVPDDLSVYLRNGHYYAEYVGVSEIASNNIHVTLTKNNLLGEEYAIITVSDWTGDTTQTQAFQVKLIGYPTNCYASDGTAGTTSAESIPRLLFNWDWNNILKDTCDSTNSNYSYCDGVQFNISMAKKLTHIQDLMLQNRINELPSQTAFYAHLIKDNYNQNLLNDFDEHYSAAFLNAGTSYSNIKKFITENRLSYKVRDGSGNNTTLPYGGVYRVEINIQRDNNNLLSLMEGPNTNADIEIVLTPIERAPNYNPFYETPFDGEVGTTRNNYGTMVDTSTLKLNELTPAFSSGNSAMQQVNVETTTNLAVLDNEIVLDYDIDSMKMIFNPSQPTPTTATIVRTNGNAKMEYTIQGAGASSAPTKTWQMTSSTIGNSNCMDFEDQDRQIFVETKSNNKHSILWPNTRKSGLITLATVFFTPKNPAPPLQINPANAFTTLNAPSNLINANSIALNNFDAQAKTNYDTLDGLFQMVRNEEMCISINSEKNVKIFWNPDYLDSLIQNVETSSGSSCN